ncbi:SEC14L1 [Symbiodinium sp. KB8]|nr:SEC14L1 [Symbiodinium sp. KB8]
MGAHKLDSDVFSVLRLWEWFIALSNQDLGSADKYKGLEETACDYVAACPPYLGRTPSYIEFGEMDPEECDKDVPGPYLRMRFEESDDGIYRWRQNIAEEKRSEINDAWRPLPYDYLSGTFCSPSTKIPGPGADRFRPLPNKLCDFNSSKFMPISSLACSTSWQKGAGGTGEHEETDEKGSVVMEEALQRNITSGRTESKKTFVSGVMAGWECPRKVVTWLLENRSLSDLIPGRRKGRKRGNDWNESTVTSLEDGAAEFYQKCETITVKAMPIKAPGGGFIYQYSTDDRRTWQALSYAEERKEWVRTASSTNLKSDEDGIPCEAIMAITSSEEASAGMASSLNHCFKRPQYLAEALTHYSAQSRAVRSKGHLVLVGEIAMEHYVSDKVVKEAMFFGSHLVVGHKEGQPLSKTLATPKGLPPPRAPPPTEENRGGVDNVIAPDRRIWVCCHHVSYAARSILTGLHESMNKDSRELEEAINRFAKEFEKRSQPKDQKERNVKWQQLFKSGAPKAFCDVFLAVIGAIAMDSDYFEAEQLMLQHYQDSERIFDIMKDREHLVFHKWSVGNEKIVTNELQITARLFTPRGPPAPNGFVAEPPILAPKGVSSLLPRSGPMNACAPWKDNVDDFAAVYEPLSKDGAFIPFRPRAPEDMQEPLSLERSLVRYVPVAPPRVRRLVSAVRSREALKQREMDRQVLPLADAKNVEDEYHEKCLDDAGPGYAVEVKQDVDTEAEDSEVSTAEVFNDARPTFRDYSRQAPDGCVHLIVPSKGPLYSHDEPPDFLQLPEPIKQRTAGAARVAAAARAWAAASAHSHPHGRQEQLPATARGVPSPQHAAIAEELNFRGPGPVPQFGTSARPSSPQADPGRQSQVETRQAVAGPAVLALRRMRNQMSALAEGRLPWHFSRDRQNEEAGAEHVPHPPQQPPSGQRRPLLPNLGRVVGSAAGTSAAPVQNQGSAADGLQMQSLVPAPPSQPKPTSNAANSRFWRRPWPRMNIMGTLGWGGSGGSSSGASSSQAPASSGAASSSAGPTLQGEQSRPGTQATNSVPGQRHAVQDPTPSSGSSAMASPP